MVKIKSSEDMDHKDSEKISELFDQEELIHDDEEGSKEEALVMESKLLYSLSEIGGQELLAGEGKAQLFTSNLTLLPGFGDAVSFSYRSIIDINPHDYLIEIVLNSNEKLILSQLGLKYEDFVRTIVKQRNELIVKDMLMEEKLREPVCRAAFSLYKSEALSMQGEAELRLYETALVVMPDRGEVFRIPYSDVVSFIPKDYVAILTTENGDKLLLSQMGSLFDPFSQGIAEANSLLQQKVNNLLLKLIPGSDPAILRKVGKIMKEGRAGRREDIEGVSQAIWKQLEKQIGLVGLQDEYEYLKSLSQELKICIGVKQGLVSDDAGEYVWFLIPMYSPDKHLPGNAIAMEASSKEGSGRATYFFRIMGRKEYAAARDVNVLDNAADNVLKSINRAMIDINFRREPVYLTEDQLDQPRYQRYMFAVQKMASLQQLRLLFIGRVTHTSLDQWKADVTDLLKFNISADDDLAKWKKTSP